MWRVRGLAARQLSAPGAQEFLPPTRASWLPPQRTFSSLSREGFHTQALEHYEVGVDRLLYGATIGVRAFRQQVDDQMVTLFGLRQPDGPAEALGHYYVGTAGDADIDGVGLSVSHALTGMFVVRWSIPSRPPSGRWPAKSGRAPAGALHAGGHPASEREHIHDLMTSIETEVPQTATRVVLFYRVNNAFVKAEGAEEVRGSTGASSCR